MIDIQMKRGLIHRWQKWFHDAPSVADSFKAVHYIQSHARIAVPGFVRESFLTRLIDLRIGTGLLLRSYPKGTRYEILRAKREGVSVDVENDLGNFVKFYNSFAATKDLSALSLGHIGCYVPYLRVTKAVRDGIVLTMHSYLLDEEGGRARLLHSASVFRTMENSKDAALIGHANRLHHHEDMVYFLDHNVRYMDLGGHYNGSDPKLLGINRFKESFGGDVVEESNYLSVPLYLYRLFSQRLGRWQVLQAT